MNIIQQLEAEQLHTLVTKRPVPNFEPGDTVNVNVKIVDGDNSRIHINVLLNFFNEAEHIAHSQNAVGNTIRMERLKSIGLFTDADKLQRLASNGANGKRRTTACIAVHFREDNTGDAQAFVKLFSRFHGILPSHSIGHEQDFHRVQTSLQFFQFHHQGIVDVEAAGSVHNDHVATGLYCFFTRAFSQFQRLHFAFRTLVNGNLYVFGDNPQLFPSGRTVNVDGDQKRGVLFFSQPFSQLAAGCSFARTLQPDDHDDRGRFVSKTEPRGVRAQNFDQFFVDNFDYLLAWGKRIKYFFTQSFFFNGFKQLFDDAEMHIGFQEGDADLPQRGFHILSRQFPFAAEVLENLLQLVA